MAARRREQRPALASMAAAVGEPVREQLGRPLRVELQAEVPSAAKRERPAGARRELVGALGYDDRLAARREPRSGREALAAAALELDPFEVRRRLAGEGAP